MPTSLDDRAEAAARKFMDTNQISGRWSLTFWDRINDYKRAWLEGYAAGKAER